MEPLIQEFIQGKTYALVGASRSGKKFGNTLLAEMKQRGYQLRVVHPEAQQIDGETCYPNLAALPGPVDGLVICVPPAQAGQVLREAAQAGIRRVWLQQGSQSPEVLALAKELGLSPVTGKCLLMYAGPVGSVHAWHRAFARLFGQY